RAEIGQATGIALVVGDPVEELLVIALREIGAIADTVLAAEIDHVFHRLDIVVDGRIDAAGKERREHGHADEAAVIDNEAQLFVALVARMLFQAGGQAVRIGDRLLRGEDDVAAADGANMRQVAEDTEAVHLGHNLAAEVGEATVPALVAAGADE